MTGGLPVQESVRVALIVIAGTHMDFEAGLQVMSDDIRLNRINDCIDRQAVCVGVIVQ